MKYISILFLLLPSTVSAYSYKKLSLITDVTWASMYMTDGFSVGRHPVIEPSLTVELPKTEFALMAWSAIQLKRSEKYNDEYDAFIFYNHQFFSESSFSFNFHSFYDYWFYPNEVILRDDFGDELSRFRKHGSKVHAGISMTNLIPLAGSFLIPSYNVYYWIYWAQNRRDLYQGGALHQILLSYSRSFATISASGNYHNGAFGVKPGISHSTASFLGSFPVGAATFSLSLNKQWTFEPSVNSKSPLWTTASWTMRL